MATTFNYLLFFLLLSIEKYSCQQHLLGTHFYVNQENVLIDNTLKTVSTLARPYDLVAFIRQSERLARVDHLQTYIDAVDDVSETSSSSSSSSTTSSVNNDKQDKDESFDKCNEFIRDGESLIFQILQTNLYDTFHIPFELKGLPTNSTINEKKSTKIFTCTHFCQIKPSLLTYDHLPSISTRYEEQEIFRIDDEDVKSSNDFLKQARWSMEELSRNQTSWLAYVHLSRYYHSNSSYSHAIDCLRCALIHGSVYHDVILVELANLVFRYGYIRDAIIFLEKALDYHLRLKTSPMTSIYIRSILHFYLGNLCTIDSRFLLAIQFYNRTKILLERIRKYHDEQQLESLSSSSLGLLSISSLSNIAQEKIDALHCHLILELSLQEKHHILQTKLAQLNQLRSITDELIHLNALIKRDMSTGQSHLDYIRQLKDDHQQMICDWKKSSREPIHWPHMSRSSVSKRKDYLTLMKREQTCSIDEIYFFMMENLHRHIYENYDCRPRDDYLSIDEDSNVNDQMFGKKKSDLISSRLAAIERTQSLYVLDDDHNLSHSNDNSGQITSTATATSITLTSRVPPDVVIQPANDFLLKQSNELYPPFKPNTIFKLNEQQLPSYTDCQSHYYGLPSIGDYPTIWLPLENKGLLNIKQAFYQGLNYQNKNHPLPWSPPLCTLTKALNERLAIIENHPVFARRSRSKAPINRYDTNMLLNLYIYIDSIIDESLPIEEFGQRLRSVGENHEHLLPEWIVHLLSSLYWRITGHLPHAIECGLKAHEIIIRNKTFKQWSDLTLINLANILYLWGKYEDALDLTQQAYAINSHEPMTNYFLGNLLALVKNNHTAAQEHYRRTLTIEPTNIYARRQLRLSSCHTMYKAWESIDCSEKKNQVDDKSSTIESTKCNSILSEKTHKSSETHMNAPGSGSSTSFEHDPNLLSQQSMFDVRSSIDRWLNRSSSNSSSKREELLNDARRAYRLYNVCSSSSIIGECSQGFAVTNQGDDIGHILIVYDSNKQRFDYSFTFTNDYESLFLRESKSKCLIFGTGRKSSACRQVNFIDPNEFNPKHNMTWWRDPSTLYEHLKELIELMNSNKQIHNQIENHSNIFYEKFLSDQYLFSRDIQEKYFLQQSIVWSDNECRNRSNITYTPYLSTWISPQTKNIALNYTFFKHLKKDNSISNEPICSYPNIDEKNSTANIPMIDYILKKVRDNLDLYKPETILKPILFNLLFEKNPHTINRDIDDRHLLGSFLATGLSSSFYNSSWLYFHTLSLYWRLMGNASEALNCLFQSHLQSPSNVQDYTYLSMALILYNSQRNLNEAIYFLYQSLSIDSTSLLLTHFTLGNALARKGHLDLADKSYQSTLKIKSDFEPAKQRLRAIRCS